MASTVHDFIQDGDGYRKEMVANMFRMPSIQLRWDILNYVYSRGASTHESFKMESTEHDFIQDEVGEEEKNLAQKLKDLCKDGKEMKGTKLEAAPILHELAKIYKQKDEMLNMTRSAALYNAAIVRNSENQRFKDELKALCSAVLVKANSTNRDLNSLITKVKKKLDDLRKEFGKTFNQLEKIPCGLEDDQLIKLQRKKILDVKNIQQEVTRRYTELMRFISDECIEIMGAPPCKYAVVGLGSLAQSGITLYSDFEHIIVLDNDVAKIKDRKMIMKYFRWFTTIFNVILINLGETMINCVAIPSINPRYRDWFTDTVTPNGVTFDGIVAHACIRPLGRPATKEKPWNTEFIKPVDEMVQYLDSDEGKDQGYHVADALSKACFVAGDEVICAEYQEKAYLRIKENDKENLFSTVFEQIEGNLQKFYLKSLHTNAIVGLQNYNIKTAIYRGATIFISAIGRLHSLQASSCFDVINGFEKHGKCSKEVAHQLRFMVAVACEFRAKVYHSKEQQDDVFMEDSRYEDLISGLIKIVGKQSLVSFMETMIDLQETLKLYKTDYGPWKFKGCGVKEAVLHKMQTLYFLGLFEDLVELTKQTISSSQADSIPVDIYIVELAFQCKKYDLVIEICSKINQFKYTANEKFEYKVYELASIVNRLYNKETNSFEVSRSVVEDKIQELEKFTTNVKPKSITEHTYHSVKTYSDTLKLLYGKVPNNSNIHTLREQVLELKYDTMDDRIKTEMLCDYANTMIKDRQPTEAWKLKLLDEAKQMMQPYKNTTTVVHRKLYHVYAVCYNNTGRYYEALICWLEYVRICKKLKQPIPSAIQQEMKNTFHRFIFCHPMKLCKSAVTLNRNRKPTEALKLLDEAKQLMQPYKITTTVVHRLLYDSYEVCYHNTGRYYEALICGLEYARICKKLKQPIPGVIKQEMKGTFQRFIFHHPMKLCKSVAILINNGKHTEALKLLDEAKRMMPYKITITVAHMRLYNAYAACYYNTGRFYEALICLLEYARICKKLMEPIPYNIKQGMRVIFHQFIFRHPVKLLISAGTLIDNGKPTEALKLLDEAKQMMQRYKITTTHTHMRLYLGYVLCYRYTGRYYEGLICSLEYARICKKIKQPIFDRIERATKLTFHQFTSL